MKITIEDLRWAVSRNLLTEEQVEPLWKALENRPATAQPRFEVLHVFYYLGALIVMSAMGWFMTLGWQQFGGFGIFVIASGYAAIFVLVGRNLWNTESLQIPGGLLMTMAVWMTPLAIYGLEWHFGLWPQGSPGAFRSYHQYIKASWVLMELGTIAAGFLALRFFRFPFLTFPIAFSLWFLSMDLTPLLLGQDSFSWDQSLWISLWFGLAILLAAYLVDRRTKEDFAFWGYLFGLLAFWGGLSLMGRESELGKFLYCLLNVGLIFLAPFLERRIFAVFGSLGVFGYLGYLSYWVFANSILFPFALSLLGLLIIALGVLYQRNKAAVEKYLLDLLPAPLKRFRPGERTTD